MKIRSQMVLRIIGAKIVYYRTLQNIQQEELAARTHISKRTLSKIEHGSSGKIMSITELWDIACSLRMDISHFLQFNSFEKSVCANLETVPIQAKNTPIG